MIDRIAVPIVEFRKSRAALVWRPYEIKSDTTDRIAMHKGSALTKLRE